MEKLVITAAIVGAFLSKEQHPALPVSPEEIRDEVNRGLQNFHTLFRPTVPSAYDGVDAHGVAGCVVRLGSSCN